MANKLYVSLLEEYKKLRNLTDKESMNKREVIYQKMQSMIDSNQVDSKTVKLGAYL